MMKPRLLILIASAFCSGFLVALSATASEIPPSFIYETAQEFFGSGDFDGDGRSDVIIMDKETGKFRIGYQLTNGVISWGDCRPTGEKGVTGFTVGKLFDTRHDAVAVTVPEANRLVLVEATNPTETARPHPLAFDAALGPNTVIALDIGGQGNDPKADLYVASMYNSPDPYQASLLRNDGSAFPKIADAPLTGAAGHGNHLALKTGGPEFLAQIVSTDQADSLVIENLQDGKAAEVFSVKGLAKGSEYAAGHYRQTPLLDLIFYKPGDSKFTFRPVEQNGAAFAAGPAKGFDLSDPVLRIIPLEQGSDERLFVIFGKGEKGGLYDFDGKAAPRLVQTIVSTNELLTGAETFEGGLLAFSHQPDAKASMRYLSYKSSGKGYEFSAFGSLPSLADNDNMTIPEIHERITAHTKEKSENEMKAK